MTYENLKSKWYYRLLKVIYIFSFLFVLGFFNYFTFFEETVKKVDQDKTVVQCTLKDKKSFSPKSINLNLDNYHFKDDKFDYEYYYTGYSNEYDIKSILEACYSDAGLILQDNIFDQQKVIETVNKYGLLGKEKTPEQLKILDDDYLSYKKATDNLIGNMGKIKYLDFSIHLFDIQPYFTYQKFLFNFFIGNFIILAIFEILRRTFYYIVLGTIKPQKE